jgi:hypothetical protein
MDYDASRGTDYNIGQATVASMPYSGNDGMFVPQLPQPQQSQASNINLNAFMNTGSELKAPIGRSHVNAPHDYMSFSVPVNPTINGYDVTENFDTLQHISSDVQPFGPLQSGSIQQFNPVPTPAGRSCCGSRAVPGQPKATHPASWRGLDAFQNDQTSPRVASKEVVY